MGRQIIDYVVLLKNVEQMINLLEYDSMRSSGKSKVNAHSIHDLYELADRYRAKVAEAAKPEVVAKPIKKSVEE